MEAASNGYKVIAKKVSLQSRPTEHAPSEGESRQTFLSRASLRDTDPPRASVGST